MYRPLAAGVLLIVPLAAVPGSAAVPAATISFQQNRKTVVQTPNDCAPAEIMVTVNGPAGSTYRPTVHRPDGKLLWPAKTYKTDVDNMWGLISNCPISAADQGKYTLRVVVRDKAGKLLADRSAAWWGKRDSRITAFNAAPEPVKSGGRVTVSGRLTQWSEGGTTRAYVAAPGRSVRLYFRLKNTTQWKLAATVKTGRDGRFSKTYTARNDGTWRAEFPGNAREDRQISASDYLDVR